MSNMATIDTSEEARIKFLEGRDGKDKAIKFAYRTMRSYRRAMIARNSFARDKLFRREFIQSYLYLKRYLFESGYLTTD